ncbi:MAG: DUF945 domain-containing protein [Betaproteobacteria bacterium]|nr:DUF945 domain-containing protein [Betaproteobacteria bacterium]
MNNGRPLIELAQELDRCQHAKKDMIVPSSLIHHETDTAGTTAIVVEETDGLARYGITNLARRQLAEKLKIPFQYFERMRSEQPRLLDDNVNTWLREDSDNRMLRTLDGNVRAVLSDRYRLLDNFDLAEHVLPIFGSLDEGKIASCELTETRMYLKFILPTLKYEMEPGDLVQAGVVVSNSEVGMGTLSVQPLLYRLVCSNGLIVPDHSLRKTHIGRVFANAEEAIQVFKDDTLIADDKAFFLKVRDVVMSALSEVTFKYFAARMQKTMGIPITGNPVKTVEVLGQRHDLSEDERVGVLRHLIEGGKLSGYGLVNAVTRFARDAEDYDRGTELEALGGKLIAMNDSEWRGLAEAA